MDKSLDKLAVLYADVSGSTALYEKFGDEIARADMASCIELLAETADGLSAFATSTVF